MKQHPAETRLALLTGDDLPFMDRLLLRTHVRRCASCAARVRALREGRQLVAEAAVGMPPGLDWERLGEEITANIHVGLAAGECVAPVVQRRPRSAWAMAAALSGIAALLTGAMWINMPREQAEHLIRSLNAIAHREAGQRTGAGAMADNVVLEASPTGIELKANGTAMKFVNARADSVDVSINMQGSADARYVDPDTGVATITKVYYAQ